MPEITLLGWFHTIIAIVALLAGFYTLAVYKIISLENRTGQVYLVCTMIAAVTALMIYNQGGFGPAHILAVLTILALVAGFLVSKIPAFSKIAAYFQAFCYSGTLLFHMIPAITDGLLRLPVNDPILSTFKDPLLLKFYLLFVVIFIIGYVFQFFWIKKQIAAV
ncbi:MAG: hypothetical protein COA74_07835 [Gammaproteobacteria bacterium]|nr:MAG: hypothetical protein COA74_07835 [Gammaproteobacteria bacterium]